MNNSMINKAMTKNSLSICLVLLCSMGQALSAEGAFPKPADHLINRDTLEYLISKNAAALGGKRNVEAIRTIVRVRGSGNTITVQQFKPYRGAAVFVIDTVKWKIRYAEGANAEYYWEQHDADSPRRIVKGRPDTAIWQTRQNPANLFLPLYKMRQQGHKIEYAGREMVEGINYYLLETTLSNGSTGLWYLNPNSFQIERNRGFRRHHAYQPNVRHIETVWKDFRNINNVVIPFIEQERDMDSGEVLSGGKPSMSIEFNIPVDENDLSLNGSPDKWINYLKNVLAKHNENKNPR
jgi:hypothetical protein